MGLFNKKKAKDNLPDTYEKEAVAIADLFLPEYEIDLSKDTTFSFPIGELGILGTAAASLIPSLRIVTETVSVNTTGVYRLANASAGDVLKKAKDGNFWGSMKKAAGGSKMAKFGEHK